MTNLDLLKQLMVGYGLDRRAVADHLGYSVQLVHSWFMGRRQIDPADLDLLHYIVAVRPLLRKRQPIQAMALQNEWDLLKSNLEESIK